MTRRLWPVGLILVSGCLTDSKLPSPLVSLDPFANGPTQANPGLTQAGNLAPATAAAAKRVSVVGQKVLLGNQKLGLSPHFDTIGAPREEVFHMGTSDVYVTEGLVARCTTEGQLAAVLCRELGKMVAERDALTPPDARESELLPPIEVPVGNDGGLNGPADGVHRIEMAKFERKHPRNALPPDPVDPDALARKFLERAGYKTTDLDEAAPILQAAEANYVFEKQLARANAVKATPPAQDAEPAGVVKLAPPIPVGQPGTAVAPMADGKNGTNP